jgi:dolichyl-phosphate beta-glucosyltransferase
MNDASISFVIPAFNEEDRLVQTVNRLKSFMSERNLSGEIIVVNDGSKDKTFAVATQLGVKCVGYAVNKGISYAFRYGTRFSTGTYIIFFPADVDSPEIIDCLLSSLDKGADVVQTSKRHSQSTVIGYSKARWFFSNNWNRAIRLMFLIPYSDTDYIRAFRHNVVDLIVPKCRINGAAGEPELIIRAHRAGFKIEVVPCRIVHSEKGRVKIKFMVTSVFNLITLRISLFIEDFGKIVKINQ